MKRVEFARALAPVCLATILAWSAVGCGEAGRGEFREFTEREDARAAPEFAAPEQPPGDASPAPDDPAADQPEAEIVRQKSQGDADKPAEAAPPAAVAANGASPRPEPREGAEGDLPASPSRDRSPNAQPPDDASPDAPKPAQPSAGDQAASTAPAAVGGGANGADAVETVQQAAATEEEGAGPREIKLLVPERDFRVEGPDGAVRVSYDDIDLLKVLNMEPVVADCVDYFPQWLKDLDGRRIRIRGFMVPPFQETNIPFFVLARDNEICCFGRDPKRYDVIDVLMRKGVTTNYIQARPFDVVGTFYIRPEASRGELYQLYVIEDAVVIDR